MPQEQDHFNPRHIDSQIDQLAQSATKPPQTLNARVIQDLQSLHSEQQQQEQAALERMRQRLAFSVASKQKAAQTHISTPLSIISSPASTTQSTNHPTHRNIHVPHLNHLERAVAILIVIAIIAAWLALRALPHSANSTQPAFNDANAPSLGSPITTVKGEFTSITAWSPDGHTFNVLGSNSQHQIIIYSTNVVTGHSTTYPVLNASWFPSYSIYNEFLILQGRYLVAIRAVGTHQAMIEDWDIIEGHAISTHTMPALTNQSGQVDTPLLSPSHNEQKFAMLSLDGTVTIWDVASGQPIQTCTGIVSSQDRFPMVDVPPTLQWYNNDQSLLYNPGSATSHNDPYSYIAWNTATGKALFSTTNTKMIFSFIGISPDSKYLAMFEGKRPASQLSQFHADTIKVINAYSGQQLLSHSLFLSRGSFINATWLPDSRNMLARLEIPVSSLNVQMYTWNVFTGKSHPIAKFSSSHIIQSTPDQQYLTVGVDSAEHSIDIWKSISGQHIATITTPGIYIRSDSYYTINNQYILIGFQGNFNIWDVTSGKMLYKYHGTTPYSISGVDAGNIYFSPDNKYLVLMAGTSSTIGNGQIAIWHLP